MNNWMTWFLVSWMCGWPLAFFVLLIIHKRREIGRRMLGPIDEDDA